MSNEKDWKDDAIKSGLIPLFEKAERQGLWFWCAYQNMWFSPRELQQKTEGGLT